MVLGADPPALACGCWRTRQTGWNRKKASVKVSVGVYLQSFGGRWWSLELQREHASVEGQVVELHTLTEDGEEERSL